MDAVGSYFESMLEDYVNLMAEACMVEDFDSSCVPQPWFFEASGHEE
jgi:hypothetical protein